MLTAVLLLMFAALCCSHFFSASETAFFSLRKVDLVSLRRFDDRRSRLVVGLLERPNELLVTVLLGNMVVNVFYASLSVVVAYEISGGDLRLALVIKLAALVLLILVGEVVPKYIAVSNPERMSLFFSIPITVFKKAASPAVAVASRISSALTNLLVKDRRRPEVTAKEFDVLLKMGEDQGVIDSMEEDFLQGILDMREVRVSEIMTPRVDVAFAEAGMSRTELEGLARERKCAKLPVFDGTMDNVVGVIHVKDLIFSVGEAVSDIVRPVEFVPENILVGDLLSTLRKEKENFAVVVDEYGGTAGVVSLEDVLEEVVGEIEDKYDQEKPQVRELEPGKFAVDGSMSIRDWNERFQGKANEDGFETIAGYVMSVLDRPLAEGDTVKCGRLKLTVSTVVGRRATEIVVEGKRLK